METLELIFKCDAGIFVPGAGFGGGRGLFVWDTEVKILLRGVLGVSIGERGQLIRPVM